MFSPPRRLAVLVLFFVSGGCALAYEIVWMRRLALLLGASTEAVTIVLASFMAGLALGASFWGRVADRHHAPLRLYGYLEIGVAAFALLVPFLIAVSEGPYVALARGMASAPTTLAVLRALLAVLVLGVPTMLMGGTLPLLVRYFRAQPFGGGPIGALYTANLLGAASGTLLTGFIAVRQLGLTGTERAAAALNLAVGIAALVVSRRATTAQPVASPPASDGAGPPGPEVERVLWVLAATSGFCTMGFEVLWSRMLVFGLNSTVYSFTLILATFLGGLALGGLWLTSAAGRGRDLLGLLSSVQAVAALSALALSPLSAMVFEGTLGLSGSSGDSALVYLVACVLMCALVMVVPTTCMGFTFPACMHLLTRGSAEAGRRIGTAYLVNTAGAVAGSCAAGYVLMPAMGLKGALLLLAVIQLGAAVLVWPWTRAWRRGLLVACVGGLWVADAATGLYLPGPNPFDPAIRRGGLTVRTHADGRTGSVTVTDSATGVRQIHIDGFVASSDATHAAYMATMTHVPMLVHPDPRRVLVICFGTGTTAGAVLAHPGATVRVVDINEDVFHMAPLFQHVNEGVAEDSRAELIVDDGRHHLVATGERYDVITLEPMPPTFAGVVNLYTREYYELAHSRLQPGGIVAQWLPLHLVTFEQSLDIVKTVQSVFPETALWIQDATGIIVARRDAPITLPATALLERLTPALQGQLARYGVPGLPGVVERFALGPHGIRRLTASATVITDDRPSLEFHPPQNRFRRGLDESISSLAAYSAAAQLEEAPLDGGGEAASSWQRARQELLARRIAHAASLARR
jgi:spermidine synthase